MKKYLFGMSPKEEKERNNLSHNIPKTQQKIKILLATPGFQKEVEGLQKKWGVEITNLNRSDNLKVITPPSFFINKDSKREKVFEEARAASTKPRALFERDLMALMRQYNLDKKYWLPLLWEYVRTGEDTHLLNPFHIYHIDAAPIVRYEKQQGTDMPKIIIEIGENTTLKDVKSAWSEVEELRKRLSPVKRQKFKEWSNFDRDTRIYSLYEDGNTLAEICFTIEKEYGDDLDYGNIKKIVSTYRKKIGLPKGGKLVTRRHK